MTRLKAYRRQLRKKTLTAAVSCAGGNPAWNSVKAERVTQDAELRDGTLPNTACLPTAYPANYPS